MEILKNITNILIQLLVFTSAFLSCIVESEATETVLMKSLSDASVEAITYWNPGDDMFLIVVFSYIKKFEDTELAGRKLTIYKKQNNTFFLNIFEHDAGPDSFVGMFPLGDGINALMTIWGGGSAYHFNVFSIDTGKIYSALEAGSHNYPEFVDLDSDGKEEILISEGAFLVDSKDKKIIKHPEKTYVYKWNGKNYELIKMVPWKDRLDALKGVAKY